MRKRSLPGERLEAVASFVEHGAKLCDVGSDHARLPVWLFDEGIINSAIITDIKPSPLARARAGIERAGYMARSQFFCCDGVETVPRGSFDTAVIAGMGGETIAGILARSPWLKEGYTLILQPNSGEYELRKFLCENGYRITGGRIALEGGRYYCIITAEGGSMEPYNEAELLIGREYTVLPDPRFFEYADHIMRTFDKASRGIASSKTLDIDRLEEFLRIMKEIFDMKAVVERDKGRGDI